MQSDISKEFNGIEGIKSISDDLGSDVNYMYEFGCPVIDIPFGGGIAPGKVYELYGWQSAGKSTLSLEICKAFENYWIQYNAMHKKKPKKFVVLWMEAESALDKVRCEFMGCKV